MQQWRWGMIACIVTMAGCASAPQTSPPFSEPGPEPVSAAEVPELLMPRIAGQVQHDGAHLHAPPMYIKVGNANSPPRERPQIVHGTRPSREDARRWMRRETLESPRVRNALGVRYALLDSGWLDDDKDTGPSNDLYRMVFYNYARNETVTVVSTGGREPVSIESSKPETQPAESREEVDAAVEIVRHDPRHGPSVAGLHGRGILTPSDGRDRHLYLLFYDAPRSTPARYQATVNMSTGRVVEAHSLR